MSLVNRVVDEVRRRVQQAITGHRGRRGHPLDGIRKLLLVAHPRLGESAVEEIGEGLAPVNQGLQVDCAWRVKGLLRCILRRRQPGSR